MLSSNNNKNMKIKTSKLVAYSNGFTFVNSKDQAIDELKKKGLAFGWFNGEFITVD
jgi:hypothetical protein